MKYSLCSGYYRDPAFAALWQRNVKRYASPKPENVFVLSVGDIAWPNFIFANGSQLIAKNNLGHVGELLNGKDREFCGWSAAIMTLAMASYANETDMIFLESDCLAFGPWVEQCYKDMGDGDFVFGHKQESEPWMECSQSLFLVRHRFIPVFVSEYLALGDERHTDAEGKHDNLPERKFVKIETKFGTEMVKRLSFGVDRCRPIPYDSPVFYCQRLTPEELTLLKERGLL